jgi:hypothetical protein
MFEFVRTNSVATTTVHGPKTARDFLQTDRRVYQQNVRHGAKHLGDRRQFSADSRRSANNAFRALKISEMEAREKFGFLLDAAVRRASARWHRGVDHRDDDDDRIDRANAKDRGLVSNGTVTGGREAARTHIPSAATWC